MIDLGKKNEIGGRKRMRIGNDPKSKIQNPKSKIERNR